MLVQENKHYEDYTSITDFTEDSSKLLFESYVIFDELHREELNRKIVDHYLFDEIAVTPYSKWQFLLNRKMREIMPYYNKLYLSELDIDDVYDNVDLTETLDRSVGTDTETSTDRSSTNVGTRAEVESADKDTDTTSSQTEKPNTVSTSETARSDVPFNKNENDNYPTETEKGRETVSGTNLYTGNQNESETRSNLRDVDTTDETVGTSSSLLDSNTLEVYTKKMKGKNGNLTKVEIFKMYRETLLDVDMMIIEELKDMFMFILN